CAPDLARKTLGHFEEKHWWLSGRYRFLAESHSCPDLFVLSAERKAAHRRKMDRLPAVARVPAEGRSGGGPVANQLVCCRIFSRPAACLSRRWHSHRHGSHTDRPELCPSDRRNGRRAYHDSVYRDHYLLCAACSHRRFSMGRLDSSDWRDSDIYRHTEPGRALLRAAHCGELCRLTSNDCDRFDFCLGADHWRSHRSTACRAA